VLWLTRPPYLRWSLVGLLVIISRRSDPDTERAFRLPLIVPIIGAVATIYGIYQAVAGAHGTFIPIALCILVGSLVAAVISYSLKGTSGMESQM